MGPDDREVDAWGIDYYDPPDVDNEDQPMHDDQGELFEAGAYDHVGEIL